MDLEQNGIGGLNSNSSYRVTFIQIDLQSNTAIHLNLQNLNLLELKFLFNSSQSDKALLCFTPSACRYFNSLQSECFSACFLSDVNMVISAPTGSGKTVLFELCILRLLSRFISEEGRFIHVKGTLKTVRFLTNNVDGKYVDILVLH